MSNDIDKNSFIMLRRSIINHWLFPEKREFTKLEAWLYILMKANYKDNKILVDEKLVPIKRGEFFTSQMSLSTTFRWDRSRTRSFLKLLESDDMITVNSTNKYTIITICNYDVYNTSKPSTQQPFNNNSTSTQQQHNTTNKGYKDNKGNKDIELYSSFEVFWELYDKKKGKKKVLQKWLSLSDKDRDKILQVVPDYVSTITDKQYQKDPLTYLNGEHWEDDIQKPKTNSQQRHWMQNYS